LRSKVENRNSKIETGNSKVETRNSKFEIRNWKLENRNWKLENGNSRPPYPSPFILDPLPFNLFPLTFSAYCLLLTAFCLLPSLCAAAAAQQPPSSDTSSPSGIRNPQSEIVPAQQAASSDGPPPPADTSAPPPNAEPQTPSPGVAADESSGIRNPPSEITPPAPAEAPVPAVNEGAREIPLDAEPFDVRIHRRIEEYGQRHQQRERQMASYDKVSGADPGLERFADPRKVQVELGDELDREQTSEELASEYAERAHDLQGKVQALQDFITKRRRTLDELGQPSGGATRQELEVALANLARQPESPETLAEMREIDRQLLEADRNQKELPAQLTQAQQEAAGAAEELAKLKTLGQSYERESKAFSADALSARQNRLRLASRLEFYLARAQAEDELEQGRKAMASVQHLSASPEVESALNGAGSSAKSDADLEQLRGCIQQSSDVKGCRERIGGLKD
jgi:hypothetical protein